MVDQQFERSFVELRRVPLWRLRLRREAPRLLVAALALWGCLASIRFALFPPAPRIYRQLGQSPLDRAAEGFAVAFARAYLSFNGSDPSAYQEGLAPLLDGAGEGQIGALAGAGASQQVVAAEAVQEREGPAGTRIYTVAAQTSAEGTVYLAVAVQRQSSGALAVAGFPAFVGPPQAAPWHELGERYEPAQEPQLHTVVERVLRNYLAGASLDLDADLSEGAVVTTPPQRLTLEAVQSVRWVPGTRSVLAVVQASDRLGVRYTLAYQLELKRVAGRWQVAAIEISPNQT